LTKHIREANQAILKTAKNSPSLKEMGTTLVAILIVGKEMVIANVGDSRAYMFKDSLTPLTQDQTYVNYLFKIGRINADQVKTHPQRHVLLNALGLNKELTIEVETKPYRHETLLLCSDGLYNNTKEEQIQAILQTKDSVDQKVESLINLANHNGGTDNIAVALWESET
jgi:protein phosphatase